ncbi:MAG: dockerin type I domain-containing protein [Pirellulales bacterium]
MTNRRNRPRRSFLPLASQWLGLSSRRAQAKKSRQDRKSFLSMESLEERLVLSTIIWGNRGDNVGVDSDAFTATYGANAPQARAIVDRAIDDWETVINDFNYPFFGGVGQPVADNTFVVNISAADQGGGGRGVTFGISTDILGKPFAASIQMDDDGGGAGWYFDPVPADDAEFTTLLNSFSADGPNGLGGNDFYRTIVHEMGHAMGILVGGPQAINSFLTPYATDPVDGVSTLYLFQGASVSASLTDNGGGHIYEGPSVAGNPAHPFDLMNAGRTVGFPPPTRELITDLNAQILADAYGYTVTLPSTINTFQANLNTTTGVLTVNGSPGNVDDQIVIDNNGSLRVIVNGTEETFAGANITQIVITTGGGDDFVSIAADVGIAVSADLGTGNDVLRAGGGPTLVATADTDGNDLYDFSHVQTSVFFGIGSNQGSDTIIGSPKNDIFQVNMASGANGSTITFDGGEGFDSVTVLGGNGFTNERLNVGPDGGSGSHTLDSQTINFQNIEPFTTNVGAANFTLSSVPGIASLLDADNAITLTDGQILAGGGRITVDSFEPVEFANKTNLTIDAGNGDDVIAIENVNTPTGLNTITVDGGPPSASDTLVVSAIPGVFLDNFRIQPTAQGAGTVDRKLGVTPTITYGAIETIRAVLQFNEDDVFSIDGTTGDDLFQAQLSETAGSATFTGLFDQNNNTGNGPFTLPTIVVSGSNPGGGTGIFNNFGNGGTDELRVNGNAIDEQFRISESPFGNSRVEQFLGNTQLNTLLFRDTDFTSLTVDAGGGSDQITVVPELTYFNGVLGQTLPVAINVAGGGSSDRLLIDESARLGAAEPRTYNVLPLAGNNQATNGNITGQTGGGFFTLALTYEGVEQVQLVGDGDDTLNVNDDGQDSVWSLSAGPTILLESGRVGINDRSPVDFESFRRVVLQNTGGVDHFLVSPDRLPAFSVAGNQFSPPAEYQVVGGNTAGTLRDTLEVEGTGRDDVQQVVLTSTAITLGRTVGYTDVAAIEVHTADGDDSLEIDTTGGFVAPHVVFDGGSGQDTLLVRGGNQGVDELQFYSGPVANTGRLVYEDANNNQLMQVDYANLEPVLDNVAAAMLTVFGTNAANQMFLGNGPGGLFFGAGNVTGLVGVDAFETLEFTQKTQVTLAGGAGTDAVSINLPNTPLGLSTLVGTPGILVDGQGPNSGDALLVNGTQNTVSVALGAPNSTIDGAAGTGALPVRIRYTNIEGLDVKAGVATTLAVSGATSYIQSAATATDAGDLLADSFPIHYSQLDVGDVLSLGSVVNGSLTMKGTAGDDNYIILPNGAPNAQIVTTGRATVNTAGIVGLTINSGDGDDNFTVLGGAIFANGITLQTGTPSPNDFAQLTAPATPSAIVLNVSALGDSVNGITAGAITLQGVPLLVVNGGAGADTFSVNGLGLPSGLAYAQFVGGATDTMTVNATVFDDDIVVTPHSLAVSDLVEVRVNDRGPTILGALFGAPATAFTVDGTFGADTLTVKGTASADTIAINGTSVAVSGTRQVNYAGVESLRVLGQDSSDTFNVTLSAIPTFVDGGNPIGAAGDVVNIVTPVVNIAYTGGPEADEGQLSDGVNAAVSFDHIEGIAITGTGAGAATINGTNADNDISFTGVGTDDFTVSVDGGPAVAFNNFATANLNGLAGDDDIDLNIANITTTAINVDGGAPTTGGGDTVTITGTIAADAPTFTPTSANSGSFDTATLATAIGLTNVEGLIYEGGALNNTLTVLGTGGADTLIHTPGAARDAGRVAVNSLLAISYTNLGTGGSVALNGQGGLDTVVAQGTSGDDSLTLAATTGSVILTTVAGTHVAVTRVDAAGEFVSLDGLDGNDLFTLNANQVYRSVNILGGSPGGSDTLVVNDVAAAADVFNVAPNATRTNGSVTVNAVAANYVGIEHLILNASGDLGDALTVNGGALGDNTWNVSAGTNGDLVQIDDRESIEYSAFDTVALNNGAGTADLFRVAATSLANFNTSFTVNGDGNDKLELLGTNNADAFNQTAANQFTVNGVAITFNGVTTLQLTGGDGADSASADLATLAGGVTNLIAVGDEPSASGGVPGDVLSLNVAASARVTQSTDAGSGTVDLAGAATVNYTTLESLNVVSAAAASTLTVRGTNGADNISVAGVAGNGDQARVWIGSGTVITANVAGTPNFSTVNVQGRFGDDHFSITPVANVTLAVQGDDPTASDTAVVNITANTTYTPTSSSSGTVAVTGFAPVNLSTIEGLVLGGNDANLTVTVLGTAGQDRIVHTPGSSVDSGNVAVNSLLPVAYTNLGAGGTVALDGQASVDTVVAQGTAGDDAFNVAAATGTVTLTTIFGTHIALTRVDAAGETLSLDGLDGNDTFTLNANQPYATVNVLGGSPGGSDTLVVNDVAAAADVFNVAPNATRTNGSVTVNALVANYAGVEHLILNASGDLGDALTVNGAALGDNTWNVSAGTNGDLVQIDDRESIEYSAFDTVALNNGAPTTDLFRVAATSLANFNTSFTVNGDGNDKLELLGTNNADTLNQSAANQFTVNGVAITFNGVTTLQLTGGDGADSATADLATLAGGVTNLIVVGDEPSASGGVAGDTLNLNVAASARVTQSTDAGSGTVDQAGAVTVNYTTLESLNVVSAAAASTLTVRGTNGADNISVAGVAGNGDQARVWIGSGTVITANVAGTPNFSTVNVQGRFGDDHFSITPVVNVTLAVQGDDPTASDTAVVNITANTTYTPTSSSSGTVAVTGFAPVNLSTIEGLVLGGNDANLTVTVLGTAGQDQIVHTPGSSVDSGNVAVNSLLPVAYTNLGAGGTVALDGQAGVDTVVAQGTTGDDAFNVAAATGTVTLTTIFGTHIALTRVDAAGEILSLDGLDGNDTFTLNANQPYATVNVLGGSPGGSDKLVINGVNGAADVFGVLPGTQRTNGQVTVNAWAALYTGVEHLLLNANPGDTDALTVADNGLGDNLWDVSAGEGFADRVQIDDRETIDYVQFNTVVLRQLGASTDVFRIHPTSLNNYATSFTVVGDGNDTLELVGTANADAVAQVAPAAITVNARRIDWAAGSIGTLRLEGGDQADTFTVDLATLDPGIVDVEVVGDAPSTSGGTTADVLNLNVAAGVRVTQSSDPNSGAVDQTTHLLNYSTLEALNVTTNAVGSTILIRGTNGADNISVAGVTGSNDQARVWINAGTVITANVTGAPNFSTLDLQGRFGDDHFSISPVVNVALTVEGNDPTASDTAVVNVTANTIFAPTSSSDATVTVAGFAPITLATMEGVVIGGGDAGVFLTIQTPVGVHTTTLTPGNTVDSGDVQVDSFIPMSFTNLGAGQLTLDDAESAATNDPAADDLFIYEGTSFDDAFVINSATGFVLLNAQIAVSAGDGRFLLVRGADGSDFFRQLGGDAFATVFVEGNGPDDGDVLDLSLPTGAITVDLGQSMVTGFNGPIPNNTVFSDLQDVNVHAANNTLTLRTTTSDDRLEVTPLSPNSGFAVNDDADPQVNYDGVSANTLFVDLATGDDTLVVHGSATVNAINADIPAGTVTVDGAIVDFNTGAPDKLELEGHAGADVFQVTTGAIPVFVAGGTPIGVLPGDQLILNLAAAGFVRASQGPEADEGAFTVDANGVLSFDQIESATVNGLAGSLLLVDGTNADDDITLIGNGIDDFTVSVNAGPAVQYNNFAGATLDGHSGDDDFDLDVNGLNATAIVVVGNSPSTTGDAVTITGGAGLADNAIYTPLADDSGTFEVAGLTGANAIFMVGVESLAYNGEDENETLTVLGTGNADTIVHTPGAAIDDGHVAVNSLLPVSYNNLGATGTVTLNGGVGADTVVARGTSGDDQFAVAATTGTVVLTTIHGQHVALTRVDAAGEQLTLDGLDGNDTFTLNADQPYAAVNVLGGSPGGSDLLVINDVVGANDAFLVAPAFQRTNGTVFVNAWATNYAGVEHLQLNASGDVDQLTVQDDASDSNWDISAGPVFGDRVQINDRESIDYNGFDAVRLQNIFGSDVFRVHPTSLNGFVTSFTVIGDGNDKLDLVGTNNVDTFTQTTATQFTVNAVPIDFANVSTLQLTGLQNTDNFTADLSTLAGGVSNLIVDGGEPSANSDTLNLTVAANARITQSVDPQSGTVDNAGLVVVNYLATESLNIVSNTAGSTLLVRGTNDGDQIAVQGVAGNNNQGRVWIGAGTVITLNSALAANFSTLTVQGRFGDDHFSITPIANVTINVEGNDPSASDTVVVNVSSNTTFAPTSSSAATVTATGFAPVVLSTVEGVTIGGNDAGLVLTVQTPAGSSTTTLTPGNTADSGNVQVDSLVPMSFTNLGGAGSLVLADADANDTFVYLGTGADDQFTVGGTGLVNLNGQIVVDPTQALNLILKGLEGIDFFTVFGNLAYALLQIEGAGPDDGDFLFASTPLAPVTVDLGAAAVIGYGALVRYTGLAAIEADAGGAVINVVGTQSDDDVTVTPDDANSGEVTDTSAFTPEVFYTNTNGNAVNVNLAGGQDTLIVVGNALSQTFDINIPAASVRIDDLNNAVNDGIVTWQNNESLEVDGLEGDDTFNVVAGTIPLFVDGGDPIGQTAGDKFNMLAGGGPVTFEAGPEDDEGGIIIGTNARISYDHIEAGQVTDAECIIIMGTNGDDDITIIARTQLLNPLRYATADGNKDFTSTVNGGIEILWVNNNALDLSVNLYVDALSGDDDVVFRAPALDPNNGNAPIAWNVNAWVAGGSPSTVTGDQGDVFELGTPGQNAVVYTPNGYSTGVIQLDSANAGVFDTTINLVESFVCDCDNNGINEYASSDGGFEQFNYDGEGANDLLTVVDTVNNDVILHTPGARTDEGSVRVNDLLAINYENLGGNATFTIGDGGGRSDMLIAEGTNGSDTLTASRLTAAIGLINVNSQVVIQTDGIERYTLDGLEGNDHFIIRSLLADAVLSVNTAGGGPGGSDVLEVFGVAGAADTIAVTPDDTRTDGVVTVNAIPVIYDGVEHIQLNAGGDVGDALTVRASVLLGDNQWTVNAGDYGDRVQIDARETIDYRLFDTVALVNDFGTDHFRIYPTWLTGYTTSFTVTGNVGGPVDDVLELVGTPANDTVTSTATAVTINGRAITAGANLVEVQVNTLSGNDQITLGLNLAGVRKVVDAGDGDDNVDVSAMQDATIFGGLGNDVIVGSPIADLIYGGSGNDTISGLGGADTIYGDAGDDVITGGTGNDSLFGGDGSDRFIWNNGDNSDIVEGDEGVDVQIVNGAAGGDTFLLRTKTGDESRAFFERTNLVPFTIDMAKVEQVDINSGTGADLIEVRDLFTTDITTVNTNVGVDPDLDAVTVQGRSVSDNVTLSYYAAVNGVNIAGMKYDVNVTALDPTVDQDTLTFNGNDGDDTLIASDALSNVFGNAFASVNRLIVNGDDGNDSLTGFGNLNGNDGDDLLVGGSFGQSITGGDGADQLYGGGGDDALNGNAGEDTFVGGDGSDTIDGGDVAGVIEWDTILVSGTSGNDTIDVNQTSATSVTYRVNADTQTDTLVATALPVAGTRTVDEIRVEAGAGADLIRVRIADALAVDAPVNHLVTIVHGGTATAAGDRLVMIDDTTADLTLYRKGQDVTEGNVTIGPANAEPFETAFDGIERVQFLASDGTAINQNPDSTNSAGNPANRLVVFSTDMNEYNDDRFLSTQLGVPLTTTLAGTIDPGALLNPFGDNMNIPGDEDWFKVQANVTGTLDFQTMFDEIGTLASGRPGLPGNGDLDIYVYDADGTLIAGNGPAWGGNNGSGANPELNVDGDTFAENERIRIPAVQGQTYYLRVIGRNQTPPPNNPTALTGTINAFTLNVINTAVAVPFDLELRDNPVNGTPLPPGQNDNSDTGRSQFDNHTYDNTPTIVFRLDDGLLLNDMPGNNATDTPPDEVISIPFQPGVGPNGTQPTAAGFALAIFDEGATAPAAGNAGNLNIRQPLGFATQLEPGLYIFTVPAGFALNDGSHFITARTLIIDPANPQQSGWGARSDSFEIVVDRVAPPTFFGYTSLADTQHGLSASSDSGVNGYPATNVERVTNDTTPTFYGTAEADTIVRLYVETNGVAGLQSRESGAANPDLFIGLTTSVPLDGSNQFPAGNWEITSQLDLNNPNLGGFFAQDGLRLIYATGEDLAGNITPDGNADRLNIFLDTRGPQVTKVDVNGPNDPDNYNIWDHKGRPDGGNDGYLKPTPLVRSLVIHVQDLPARSNADPNFLYEALFTPVSIDKGHYKLVGDHNGIIPIDQITFTSVTVANNQIATGYVTITFFEPLPDDRFTLTLEDEITDRVGNRLDGEANTREPHDNQTTLPSGDGVPGGDFVARFTVDSRAELGTYGAESAWVDTNGNFTFDPENPDFVNRDIQYKMEWVNPVNGQKEDKIYTSDNVFVGKFTPAGAVDGNDGFDKLGAYGRQNGGFRWLIDTDNDGVADVRHFDPANINGTPVAGDFDNNPLNGDEVGVFDGTSWWLDTNHNYEVDTQVVSPIRGYAIVGDFDGDGQDDLATWQQDQFRFDFAANGYGQLDATINFGFIGVRERPVAADMDGDGIDDIGLWNPDSTTPTTANTTAEWYFLISDFPTQQELIAAAGTANLLNHAFTPVPFGRDLYAAYGDDFAVPLVGNFDPPATTTGGTNGSGNPITLQLDVNRDGVVTPLDALLIINSINGANGENSVQAAAANGQYPDVDGSGSIVPLDALLVINALNGVGNGEGEAPIAASNFSVTVVTTTTPVADDEEEETATGASSAAVAQILADTDPTGLDSILDSIAADATVVDEDAVDSLFSQL